MNSRRHFLALATAGALALSGCDRAAPPHHFNAIDLTNSTYAQGFNLPDFDGKPRTLADFKGKALLVVNVASKCGLTPQYAGLQKLHEKYAARGFEVLGFPCNQFAGQEPGSEAEIADFCKTTYDVQFPLFSKTRARALGSFCSKMLLVMAPIIGCPTLWTMKVVSSDHWYQR